IPPVKTTVSRIGVRSTAANAGAPRITDAVRPRVVAINRDALCRTALDIQQQAVVARRWPIVESVDCSDVRPDRRVIQAQDSALLRVRLSGARVVRRSGERAGSETEKHSLVDRVDGPEVSRVAAHIASRHKPVRSNLSLNAEIPLRHLRRFQIRTN